MIHAARRAYRGRALAAAGALVLALPAIGCAARPVLYPNEHRERVGAAAAQADVDACLALAKEHGASASRAKETAKSTAGGAAIGAATGAVIGAITGSAGRGAAAGAAGGGTAGFLREVLGGPRPDSVTRSFVERCLRDRGYETVGWR